MDLYLRSESLPVNASDCRTPQKGVWGKAIRVCGNSGFVAIVAGLAPGGWEEGYGEALGGITVTILTSLLCVNFGGSANP